MVHPARGACKGKVVTFSTAGPDRAAAAFRGLAESQGRVVG